MTGLFVVASSAVAAASATATARWLLRCLLGHHECREHRDYRKHRRHGRAERGGFRAALGSHDHSPCHRPDALLPVWFEVAAIFAGALAGGMTAVRLRFDITGVMVLAVVNGLGGGIIRDTLLQDYGVFALDEPRALWAVLGAALVAMFFFSAARRLRPALAVIDAFSLALFCVVGADKALVAGLTVVPAIMLGTVTAIGGGMIRDVLCDREPEILRRGSLSATAASPAAPST